MYPNMSHCRKKLANIYSNKFHKLTICNCAHMFMVSQYRTATGIENKKWRLYVGFWVIAETYPCRGIWKKKSLKTYEHLLRSKKKTPKFSQKLFCLIIQQSSLSSSILLCTSNNFCVERILIVCLYNKFT